MTNCADTALTQLASGIFGTLDHFSEHTIGPISPSRQRFNVRMQSRWDTIQVVATNDQVVSIDPDAWDPFESVRDRLVPTTATALEIVESSAMHYRGEGVHYHFDELGKGGVSRKVYDSPHGRERRLAHRSPTLLPLVEDLVLRE
jgi:hypothetical protein